ncbi:MAG: dihydroneopterin aldolase [Halioglobus sp.]|nr:dihydroneopterin aldolase [Halioglobus sp.]
MNTVFLHGLRATAVIGVYARERQMRQTVLLDLELASDMRRAADSDCIDDALDYAAVAEQVVALVEGSEYQLLEALGAAVVELLREEFAVPWLRLRLSKPGAVPQADLVGVVIESGKRP